MVPLKKLITDALYVAILGAQGQITLRVDKNIDAQFVPKKIYRENKLRFLPPPLKCINVVVQSLAKRAKCISIDAQPHRKKTGSTNWSCFYFLRPLVSVFKSAFEPESSRKRPLFQVASLAKLSGQKVGVVALRVPARAELEALGDVPLRIEVVGPRGLLRREVGRGGLGPIPAEREEEVLPVDGEGLDRPLAYVVAHLDVPVGKTMETEKKKPRYNIKCKSSAGI